MARTRRQELRRGPVRPRDGSHALEHPLGLAERTARLDAVPGAAQHLPLAEKGPRRLERHRTTGVQDACLGELECRPLRLLREKPAAAVQAGRQRVNGTEALAHVQQAKSAPARSRHAVATSSGCSVRWCA
jgi:hypothetical protein